MNCQSNCNLVSSEIVESFIVDNSFIAKSFTLADGAYSIIKLSRSKYLILRFNDNSNDSPNHYVKKILKADGDLLFFPKKSDVVDPTEKLVKICRLRRKIFLTGFVATFEFKAGSIKNLLVNILSVGKPFVFYGIDFTTFRKTLELDLDYLGTKLPNNFFFKSLPSKKKIEFIATSSVPKSANWTASEYYSWKCKGSANHIDSCEIYFPRFDWEYSFAGTYKKYLRNFKNGEINGKQLTFRVNGEVNQIAHFNEGIKNGWHIFFKKNHGLDLLTNKHKTSNESVMNHKSIAKSDFYKDGRRIGNPFIIATQATQLSLF